MNLLDDVKIKLDISRNIPDVLERQEIEGKLNLILAEGKAHLRTFAPDLSEEDFANGGAPAHYLLLNYCLYAYSNAASMFNQNYKSELLALRREYSVRCFNADKEYDNRFSDV